MQRETHTDHFTEYRTNTQFNQHDLDIIIDYLKKTEITATHPKLNLTAVRQQNPLITFEEAVQWSPGARLLQAIAELAFNLKRNEFIPQQLIYILDRLPANSLTTDALASVLKHSDITKLLAYYIPREVKSAKQTTCMRRNSIASGLAKAEFLLKIDTSNPFYQLIEKYVTEVKIIVESDFATGRAEKKSNNNPINNPETCQKLGDITQRFLAEIASPNFVRIIPNFLRATAHQLQIAFYDKYKTDSKVAQMLGGFIILRVVGQFISLCCQQLLDSEQNPSLNFTELFRTLAFATLQTPLQKISNQLDSEPLSQYGVSQLIYTDNNKTQVNWAATLEQLEENSSQYTFNRIWQQYFSQYIGQYHQSLRRNLLEIGKIIDVYIVHDGTAPLCGHHTHVKAVNYITNRHFNNVNDLLTTAEPYWKLPRQLLSATFAFLEQGKVLAAYHQLCAIETGELLQEINLDETNSNGETLLSLSVTKCQDIQLVAGKLKQLGADLNQKTHNKTLLYLAAEAAQFDKFQALLSLYDNDEARKEALSIKSCSERWSPLHAAARYKTPETNKPPKIFGKKKPAHLRIVKRCLKYIDINNQDNKEKSTPLMEAAKVDALITILYLIKKKANNSLKNKAHATAADIAFSHGHKYLYPFLTTKERELNATAVTQLINNIYDPQKLSELTIYRDFTITVLEGEQTITENKVVNGKIIKFERKAPTGTREVNVASLALERIQILPIIEYQKKKEAEKALATAFETKKDIDVKSSIQQAFFNSANFLIQQFPEKLIDAPQKPDTSKYTNKEGYLKCLIDTITKHSTEPQTHLQNLKRGFQRLLVPQTEEPSSIYQQIFTNEIRLYISTIDEGLTKIKETLRDTKTIQALHTSRATAVTNFGGYDTSSYVRSATPPPQSQEEKEEARTKFSFGKGKERV